MGMKNLQTAFKFKGVTDILPPKGEPGDIWIVGGESYVWGGEWQALGEAGEEKTYTCKNCGAPFDPYKLKCDFCGTYYRTGNIVECTCLGDSEPRYISC